MSTAPNFRRGAEAAEEASKKNAAAFAKTHFFGIKDGETAILRFLTDAPDWISVDQHAMVPTKGAPEGHTGNWPASMGAICRKDDAFTGMYDGGCYICEFMVGVADAPKGGKVKKPSSRTWGLACVREQVIEGGKVVGIRDKVREVERKKKDSDETEKIIEKDIVVVAMGWKNFWSALQGFAGHYGTVCDRDYKIIRKGASTDTDYQIIPLDPIVGEDGKVLDTRTEWGKRYQSDLDLGEVITGQSSDEFYARFFDPRYTVTGEGAERKVVQTGAAPAPKTENDVSEERLAELASRVNGYAGGNGGNGAPVEPAPAAEPASAPASGGMKNFD